MAVYGLRRLQIGKETTWGTAVAPTQELRGINDLSFEFDPALEIKGEVGHFTPSIVKERIPEISASLEMDVSYQHVLYPLAMVFGEPTPTGSGPYTWTFNAPYSAPSNPKSFTAYYGFAGAGIYRAAGLLANSLTISGNAGEDVTLSLECLARTLATQSSFETISLEDVQYVSVKHGSFYLDSFTGTIKTTPVTGTLIEFELSMDLARHLKKFISSNTQPEAFGEAAWDISLRMIYEWNSSSKSLLDDLTAGLTRRLICVSFGTGTGAGERLFEIQMPGILAEPVTLFSERDGNATVEMTWKAIYQSTLATQLKIIVKNEKSSL